MITPAKNAPLYRRGQPVGPGWIAGCRTSSVYSCYCYWLAIPLKRSSLLHPSFFICPPQDQIIFPVLNLWKKQFHFMTFYEAFPSINCFWPARHLYAI